MLKDVVEYLDKYPGDFDYRYIISDLVAEYGDDMMAFMLRWTSLNKKCPAYNHKKRCWHWLPTDSKNVGKCCVLPSPVFREVPILEFGTREEIELGLLFVIINRPYLWDLKAMTVEMLDAHLDEVPCDWLARRLINSMDTGLYGSGQLILARRKINPIQTKKGWRWQQEWELSNPPMNNAMLAAVIYAVGQTQQTIYSTRRDAEMALFNALR